MHEDQENKTVLVRRKLGRARLALLELVQFFPRNGGNLEIRRPNPRKCKTPVSDLHPHYYIARDKLD